MATLRFNKDERVTLLRGITLFAGCRNDDLRSIATLQSQCEAQKEEVLMEEGRPGEECFVIVEGTATVSRNGIRLAHLGPGDFFGELAPLDGGPRTATVVADTDMHLLVISRREFFHLRTSFPTVSVNMMAELGARLRRTDEAIDATRSVDLVARQAS